MGWVGLLFLWLGVKGAKRQCRPSNPSLLFFSLIKFISLISLFSSAFSFFAEHWLAHQPIIHKLKERREREENKQKKEKERGLFNSFSLLKQLKQHQSTKWIKLRDSFDWIWFVCSSLLFCWLWPLALYRGRQSNQFHYSFNWVVFLPCFHCGDWRENE